YVIRARAYGDQAGPEVARMAFLADEKTVATVDVPATQKAPAEYETRAHLVGGPHVVAAAFINDYYQPSDPDPAKRDRNLQVSSVEMVGPVDARAIPPSPRWIFAGDCPEQPLDVRAHHIVERLASRAWRRPATPTEVARLAMVVEKAVTHGERFEHAVQL